MSTMKVNTPDGREMTVDISNPVDKYLKKHGDGYILIVSFPVVNVRQPDGAPETKQEVASDPF